MRSSALLVFAMVCGCGGASVPAAVPPSRTAAPAPSSGLDALEQRLLAAKSFHVKARLATSGRIQSHFEGTVDAGAERRMRFVFQGAFGGKDADVLFVCDGARMRGGAKGAAIDMDAAPGMREGVALAFVRMGLTHELARLASGKTPDYIDGSVRQHLEAVGPASAPGETVHGVATEQWTWALYVDHKNSADETLWLDTKTGLPVRRRVVVHFPEGDMEVGEEYDEFTVDAPVAPETFAIAP